MARVLANHHHATVAANDLALVANLLDARVNLHVLSFLLVAVDDAATGQVVGRQLNNHAVLGEDADVVLSHFS